MHCRAGNACNNIDNNSVQSTGNTVATSTAFITVNESQHFESKASLQPISPDLNSYIGHDNSLHDNDTTFYTFENDTYCGLENELRFEFEMAHVILEGKLLIGLLVIRCTLLLHILNKYHPDLALDGRTLLSTPTKNISTKELVYFGISQSVAKFLTVYKLVSSKVKLSFNVDGIPLFKS